MTDLTHNDYLEIGRKIKDARKQAGWSQEKLAREAGVSTAFIGHIERGTRVMSLETFIKLCDSLGLSPDYVLFDILQPSDPLLLNIFHSVKKKNAVTYSRFLTIMKAIAGVVDQL